jgi:pyruvate dehydrogenase (quinone)
MIGLTGIFVDSPQLLGSAWEQALASETPVVLEVKTDPEVPPLPPHITLQQAKNFSLALMKGDPNERRDPGRSTPGAGKNPAWKGMR